MTRGSDNGYHTCELSSLERYLVPERMEERLGYDYYGTTTEVCDTYSDQQVYDCFFFETST